MFTDLCLRKGQYQILILVVLFCEGHLTSKSDVYSFGVVLLEMLSGRRAVDKNRPSGEHNLVDWAKPYLTNKRKIFRVIDNRLEGQYSPARAEKAAVLAVQCLSTEPKARPSMDEVVTSLEQICEPRDKLKSTTKEQYLNQQGQPNGGTRYHRRSADLVSYPRPSVATLQA